MIKKDINCDNFKNRPNYLDFIKKFRDKPLIKVLIGMRRVGKSVIMKLIINELLKNGVPESNIMYINKESLEFDDIRNYIDLYNFTKNFFKIQRVKNTYLSMKFRKLNNGKKQLFL